MGKPKLRISHYTTKNIPLPEQKKFTETVVTNKVQEINRIATSTFGVVSSKVLSKAKKELLFYQIESQYASKPHRENTLEFQEFVKQEAKPFKQVSRTVKRKKINPVYWKISSPK